MGFHFSFCVTIVPKNFPMGNMLGSGPFKRLGLVME